MNEKGRFTETDQQRNLRRQVWTLRKRLDALGKRFHQVQDCIEKYEKIREDRVAGFPHSLSSAFNSIVAVVAAIAIVVAAYVVDQIVLSPTVDFVAKYLGIGPTADTLFAATETRSNWFTRYGRYVYPALVLAVEIFVAFSLRSAKQQDQDGEVNDTAVMWWSILGSAFGVGLPILSVGIVALSTEALPGSTTAMLYGLLLIFSIGCHLAIVFGGGHVLDAMESLTHVAAHARDGGRVDAAQGERARLARMASETAQKTRLVLQMYVLSGGPIAIARSAVRHLPLATQEMLTFTFGMCDDFEEDVDLLPPPAAA